MKKINIDIKEGFQIYIGENELAALPKLILEKSQYDKIVIFTDTNLKKYFLPKVKSIVETTKIPVITYALEATSMGASVDTAFKISDFLYNQGFSNRSLIIALGGTKIGRLVGFVASIFDQGTDYVLIPTTFKSMCDISLTGKVIVQSSKTKAMLGGRYQPTFVLCDTIFLSSLSENSINAGLGMVLKFGLLKDTGIIDALLTYDVKDIYLDVICECCKIKYIFSSGDADSNGKSKILSLGQPYIDAIKLLMPDLSHGVATLYGIYLLVDTIGRGREGSDIIKDKIVQFANKFNFDLDSFIGMEIDIASIKAVVGDVDKLTIAYPTAMGECSLETIYLDSLPLNYTSTVIKKLDYDIKISADKLKGDINYISSCSIGHRMLAIGAFASSFTRVNNLTIDDDLLSITTFLRALGMSIIVGDNWVELTQTDKFYRFLSNGSAQSIKINIKDSPSTFAIALAICGMMGVSAEFNGYSNMLSREIRELTDILKLGGVKCSKFAFPFTISGRFNAAKIKINHATNYDSVMAMLVGAYCMRGNISIDLPFASNSNSEIAILLDILRKLTSKVTILPNSIAISCEHIDILDKISLNNASDYSNLSCWLVAKAIGADIELGNDCLNKLSAGDKLVADYITNLSNNEPRGGVDISNYPDIIADLSVLNLAKSRYGKLNFSIGKSDIDYTRADNVATNIGNIGGKTDIDNSSLTLYVGKPKPGEVDSYNDPKIAQAFAMAALIVDGEITIKNAHAVRKNYPMFYIDMVRLGANIEVFNIRKYEEKA